MTNLKRIRQASGMSQSKLAEASGVSVRMIQHYEQGVKDINAAAALTVYRLALALDCSVEDLLETPRGYKFENGKLVINDPEAETVRAQIDKIVSETTYGQVQKRLRPIKGGNPE